MQSYELKLFVSEHFYDHLTVLPKCGLGNGKLNLY